MTNAIHSTIVTAVASAENVSAENVEYSYGRHITIAADALTEREYTLTDQITERVSREFGVSEEQVRTELEGIGALVRPIPEPEVEAPAEEDPAAEVSGDDRMARLEELVGNLAGTVGKLVTLAESKLGATL